jgi:thioredoxin 1
MSQVLRLTDRNFKEEVFQSQIPVLVEFSASWCVPSQQMKPMLEKIASDYTGKVKFGNLNVDQNPRTASKYQIMGCPTFILLNSGKAINRRVGAQSKKQLVEIIQSAVDSR